MINLSADSFPVLTPRALREALAKLQGYNFMTSSTRLYHSCNAQPQPPPPPRLTIILHRCLHLCICLCLRLTLTSVTGMKPTAWTEFDEKWHKRRAFRNPIITGFEAEPHYGSQASQSGLGSVRFWLSRLAPVYSV